MVSVADVAVHSASAGRLTAEAEMRGKLSAMQTFTPNRKVMGARKIFGVGAGLLLVWLIVSHGLVANLSRSAPGLAVRFLPETSGALLQLAEQRLDQSPSISDPASKIRDLVAMRAARFRTDPEVQALARRALLADPLNARALRLLGEAAAAGAPGPKGEAATVARAASFMRAAARLSGREAIATEWMMRYAYSQKDYAGAVRYADALLRAYPDIVTPFIGPLVRMAENKQASAELVAVLAQTPPWRETFMNGMLLSTTEARAPFNLFLALKSTQAPPTPRELAAYLWFLQRNKHFEFAYYAWLQFLPPEQLGRAGLLFNADFAQEPSGIPFDWAVPHGYGVNVEIVPDADTYPGRLLRVVFGEGRAEFQGVSQHLFLAPGRYRFRSQYKGKLAGRRGLDWRLRCDDAPKQLGRGPVPVGSAAAWTAVDFEFEVPASDCRAQFLQLVLDARSASETIVQGELWFKSLSIARSK